MNHTSTNHTEKAMKKEKKKPKQIAAIICIILLVAMYLITFLVACLDFPGWNKLFAGCLLMTIALPILLWLYIWLYGMYTEKHTMASLDMMHSDENTGIRETGRKISADSSVPEGDAVLRSSTQNEQLSK